MSSVTNESMNLGRRAKCAVERLGTALLSGHSDPGGVDVGRLYFELRVVLQRVMILDRVGLLDGDLAWDRLLDTDLELQLFHVEQLAEERIWSGEWVGLVRREFGLCGGNWFGEVVETVRGASLEMGAIDESLMGWVPRIEGGAFVLVGEDGSDRKIGGVFYTPAALVGNVLDRGLSPAIEACLGGGDDVDRLLGLRVCDPACGCGYFLVEAARRISARIDEVVGGGVGVGGRMGDVVRSCVGGGEINPLTTEICRWSLWFAAGDSTVTIDELRDRVRRGDSLVDDDVLVDERIDVVVGNPPFLNQLGSGTARSVERVKTLRERGLVGGAAYTDEASAFFVLGLKMVKDCGRVCMVQPQSVVATRGGAWMRERVAEVGRLESIWVSNEHVFGDASVYTCGPCVVVGSERLEFEIERYSGGDFAGHESLAMDHELFSELPTWSSIVAVTMGVPEVGVFSDGVVGDVATGTADFRDEYYGLVGKLIEDVDCDDRDGSPGVLTTGLVDLGVSHWGSKATRIHKEKWEGPRVCASGIVGDERLGKWVTARRVEKVVVATQTKVVEAFVDVGGEFVVLTPMISVMVKGGIDVWKVGAAIGSPVCSAFAMRFFGGAAMHADALKMSARQVLELPLPGDEKLWGQGASAFERVHGAREDEYARAIVEFGELMCSAYGVVGEEQDLLMGWWLGRLGIGE